MMKARGAGGWFCPGEGSPVPPRQGVWGSAVITSIGVWVQATAFKFKDFENYAKKVRPFKIKVVPRLYIV